MKNFFKGLIVTLTMFGLIVPFASVQAQVALQITSPLVLPSGSINSPYSYKFTATGGTKPYKWDVMTQQLNVYHCCLIGLSQSGTFASVGPNKNEHMPYSGTFQIGVKVTDARGQSVEQISEFTINDNNSDDTGTDSNETPPIYGKERVVKIKGTNKLYYINARGQYIPFLNKKVFASYGNKTENLESITKKELKKYTLIKYIKVAGSDTIYEVKGKRKRPLSAEAKAKLITDSSKVLEVNETELSSYNTGKTITN